LSQGPCKDGEWLVLDKTVHLDLSLEGSVGKCVPMPCEDMQNLIPDASGECQSVNDGSNCNGDNMEMLINPYGIGECNCKEGFLPWNNGTADEVKKCYNQYSQGPCKPDCKFTWDYDTDCPKCLKTEVAKLKDLRGTCKDPEVLYPDRNGENHCYKLDTQGPCPEGELFIMEFNSRDTVKPICVTNGFGLRSPLISGFLTCPEGKVLDTRGVCKDAYHTFAPVSRSSHAHPKMGLKRNRNLRRFLKKYHKLRSL